MNTEYCRPRWKRSAPLDCQPFQTYLPQEQASVSVGSFFCIGCLQTGQSLRHIWVLPQKRAHPPNRRAGHLVGPGLVPAGAADGVDRGDFEMAVLGIVVLYASIGCGVFRVFLHVVKFLVGDDAGGGDSLANVFG